MVFPSVSFILFFLCTALLIALVPVGLPRRTVLLLSNGAFFILAPSSYVLIAYLLLVQWMHYAVLTKTHNTDRRIRICCFALLTTLVPLFWTKYALALAGFFALDVALWDYLYQGSIPVGTSFLTFGSIMVLLHQYRTVVPIDSSTIATQNPKHTPLEHLCAFLFFPVTASGPLMPTHVVASQLDKLTVRLDPLALWYIAQGLFLKLIVSAYAQRGADVFFNQLYDQNVWSLWFASILYSAQIYADFAGYSLMALGCASLLGIRIWRNFHSPYLATSLSVFWRRWHMSLAHFWRRYIYIPLGGSKRGSLRTYVNLMIVMLVCGVWHGAGFGFLVWGLLHGLYLAAERAFQMHTGYAFGTSDHLSYGPLRSARSFIFGTFTFLMVSGLWLFFRLPELEQLHIVASHLDNDTPWELFYTANSFWALVCVALVFLEQRFGFVGARLISRWRFTRPLVAHALPLLIMGASIVYSVPGIPNFIYFAF